MLVAFGAAGCGGASASHAAAVQRGSAIFADSCSGCHTLAGRESGAPGGDLVKARLSVAALISFARIMPTHRRLSHMEVTEVAEYIHEVAGR
jgi:mono/diheme cytochrome c family protein